MKIIRNEAIERALKEKLRIYLCGNLTADNSLEHIPTESFEIGISNYQQFTFEKAHVHGFNQEFNYVVTGQVKVFLLREKREQLFAGGDLYLIEPGEPYVSKCHAGTRTLFAKYPGGNDKQLVPIDIHLQAWGSSWDAIYQEEQS